MHRSWQRRCYQHQHQLYCRPRRLQHQRRRHRRRRRRPLRIFRSLRPCWCSVDRRSIDATLLIITASSRLLLHRHHHDHHLYSSIPACVCADTQIKLLLSLQTVLQCLVGIHSHAAAIKQQQHTVAAAAAPISSMQMHSPTCNERALLLSSLQTALVLFRPTGKLHEREAAGGLYGREVKPDTYGLCAGVAAHTHTQKSTDMRACRFVEGLEEVGVDGILSFAALWCSLLMPQPTMHMNERFVPAESVRRSIQRCIASSASSSSTLSSASSSSSSSSAAAAAAALPTFGHGALSSSSPLLAVERSSISLLR